MKMYGAFMSRHLQVESTLLDLWLQGCLKACTRRHVADPECWSRHLPFRVVETSSGEQRCSGRPARKNTPPLFHPFSLLPLLFHIPRVIPLAFLPAFLPFRVPGLVQKGRSEIPPEVPAAPLISLLLLRLYWLLIGSFDGIILQEAANVISPELIWKGFAMKWKIRLEKPVTDHAKTILSVPNKCITL